MKVGDVMAGCFCCGLDQQEQQESTAAAAAVVVVAKLSVRGGGVAKASDMNQYSCVVGCYVWYGVSGMPRAA